MKKNKVSTVSNFEKFAMED